MSKSAMLAGMEAAKARKTELMVFMIVADEGDGLLCLGVGRGGPGVVALVWAERLSILFAC